MLATFFLNDTFNTGDWRLKGHAEAEFWRWVASWAACVSKPSDIGYSDDGYDLPPLNLQTITVMVDQSQGAVEGELFRAPTLSATTMHKEMRLTSPARVQKVAEMVNASSESWIVWCNTNDESEQLAKAIPDALAVSGSDHSQFKEMAIDWFKGEICSCKTGKFRHKFPTWPDPDTSRNIINLTETEKLQKPLNGSEKMPIAESNTCGNITNQIQISSREELQSNSKNTTEFEEKNTSHAKKPEPRLNQKFENGDKKTLTNSNLSGSNNTALQSINTTSCLNASEGFAPSVNATQSSSLIIATLQGTSEDCCAKHAISDLESLRTAENYSSERLCICDQQKRVLISKSSIFGFGLNLQHCHNMAFVGLSYSFEDFYQALRRSYRFGQKNQVNAYIVQASTEDAIIKTVRRKIEQHQNMQERMKIASAAFTEHQTKKLTMKTDITTAFGKDWTLHHGDCVRVAKQIEDESIDFSVFSPPFADLFTYSDDLQDMGNCADLSEFTQHFELLIEEMMRIMVPGREVAVHCVDLLSTKWKHGKIEFQDFSGEIIRSFWRKGFLFHSRICIWKSPVTEMQRTKAHGLLYKTLKADSCDSRVGCSDYLLVFRKPGENPMPVTKDPAKYPVDWWQEVASPVWMTVDQGRVLNRDGARDDHDEKHICPLQLDVIDRAVTLWSNEGDLVYSPFAGIGSEGVSSLELNRRFVGSELKESYFKQACQNMNNAKSQLSLF
jgi:DNA modification methylase